MDKKIHIDKNQKINDEKYKNNNIVKKNLIEFLEKQLEESKNQIIEKEKTAEKEIEVVHNRLKKEIEKSRKFSLEKIIIEFLPIIDNIERALHLIKINISKKHFIQINDKLEFISNTFKKICILFGIEKINDINVLFNPSIHQAMSIHYTDEVESNKIVTIMQSGYILHKSRLLRPAMVVVSKKKI